jgi:hypothetical protein
VALVDVDVAGTLADALVGNALVDVIDTSVGVDEAFVDPADGSAVDESIPAGAEAVLDAGAVEDAASLDGEPSARATVAAQHSQHAASATARTATRRRRAHRLPRMTNNFQSPETDTRQAPRWAVVACRLTSESLTRAHPATPEARMVTLSPLLGKPQELTPEIEKIC